MMGKTTYSFTTTLLMRVGKTEEIQRCYDENILSFGCAANWLDYSLKQNNQITGDPFEGAFAHILINDLHTDTIKDVKGNPMGDHLHILKLPDNTCLLRYIPTILVPVLCFYTFNVGKIRKIMDQKGSATSWIGFDLNRYCDTMKYDKKKCSYLFITRPICLFNELREAIPAAINKNHMNLNSDRFYGKFDPKSPYMAKDVDYCKHTRSELFFDQSNYLDALFWKSPEYKKQSELRIAIPNINFAQTYDYRTYDYKQNILNVKLPNLKKYTIICPADSANTLYFGNFNDSDQSLTFAIYKASLDKFNPSEFMDI